MGTGLGDLWEAVSPALECSLHLQSRWFLVSSKPGRHSQAMPPLGVSRQMWAQPWFLFMQFMPSKREKEAKKKLLALVSSGRRTSEVGQDGEMMAMRGNFVSEDLDNPGQSCLGR